MNIVDLTAETTPAWHEVALESAEAWFWHTPEWLQFATAIGSESFLADRSFLIVRDRAVMAICPLVIEERGGYRRFSYLGEYVPFPAMRSGLDESTMGKTLEAYCAHLDQLAAEYGVGYARVILPTLSEAANAGPGPRWNPLLRHGFLDISGAAQVLSLSAGEAELWRGMRKGHRSDVKRAAGRCTVTVWDAASITDAHFEAYRIVHAIDAGRVTRGAATFDMMLEWVRRGQAALIEARDGDRSVAFAVIILYRAGAYYASSCKLPDLDVPAMHLMQWETIKWLKARCFARYDIGMQYFGPAWSHVPSAKDVSIASFKRGFGGETRRVDVVERFYSAAVLETVCGERARSLLSAQKMEHAE